MNQRRGLPIRVDRGVRIGQSLGQAQGNVEEKRSRDPRLAAAVHPGDRRKVDTVDVFHDDVILITDVSEVIDLNDIGVLKLPKQSGLSNQLANEVGVHRKAAMKSLQSYPSAETVVAHPLGEEDVGHAAFTDLMEEPKFSLETEPI